MASFECRGVYHSVFESSNDRSLYVNGRFVKIGSNWSCQFEEVNNEDETGID